MECQNLGKWVASLSEYQKAAWLSPAALAEKKLSRLATKPLVSCFGEEWLFSSWHQSPKG
jgi:hypothetical protein